LLFCPFLFNTPNQEVKSRSLLVIKKILSRLGQISYSIYLNHAIIIIIAVKSLTFYNIKLLNIPSQALFIITTTLVLIIYSFITNRNIERLKIFRN